MAPKTGADPGFFLSRGCTRLLLYFNTNKPQSFFIFLQNTSCIRKPQVISGEGWGVRTHCILPLDPPLQKAAIIQSWIILYYLSKCSQKSLY